MLKQNETALLPEGLHDSLVGESLQEFKLVEKLLNCFISNGYDLILPPLVEFEESLLSGPGKAHSRNMFRLMDPASQRMMGVRTDITGQIARISDSRLGNAPRPLRLSYAGDVLRVKGTQLRPERQFKQAGVELIGNESTEAYVEIILLSFDALKNAGAEKISIDLTMPLLVPAICEGLGIANDLSEMVREALDAKDMAELNKLQGTIGEISRALLQASGPAEKSLDILSSLELPEKAKAMCQELMALVQKLNEIAPDLIITVDPGEYTGFEYQTGISFSLFAKGVRGELGRGGRYLINSENGSGEPATGFSLYLDSLMRAIDDTNAGERIFIQYGADRNSVKKLQNDGYQTILALENANDIKAEAKRMNCTKYWLNGEISEV